MAPPPPRRILAVLPSWVGDTTMCTPALRALRSAFPDATIVAEGRPHLGDLVRGLDAVDRFDLAPRKGLRAAWRRSRELRAEGFDWAILFGESERVAAPSFLARIPVRAGFGRGALRRALLTHYLERPRDPDGRPSAFSMIERYLRVTRHLGIEDDGDGMELPVEPAAAQRVEARLAAAGIEPGDRVLTLIGGASFGAAKMWPPASFARAAALMAERQGTRAVIAPGPGEERIGEEVARLSGGAVTVLGDPPLALAETAALLRRSALAISNDTGPRSMAVALGLPVVVPLGPTEDGHTRHHLERQRVLIEDVDCRPCRLRTCPIDHRCMTRITPEHVVGAAEELLAAFGDGPQ